MKKLRPNEQPKNRGGAKNKPILFCRYVRLIYIQKDRR